MRALSLTQPWATLVAIGAKTIETRSFQRSYRGPLAIHAASGLGPVGGKRGLTELFLSQPFYSTLTSAGYLGISLLPLGAIVAVCDLKTVLKINELAEGRRVLMHWNCATEPLPDEPELSFGNYAPGRYAWLLANIRALPEPVPCRGALGLWDLDAATLAAVEEQLNMAEVQR